MNAFLCWLAPALADEPGTFITIFLLYTRRRRPIILGCHGRNVREGITRQVLPALEMMECI
jgi:hypothetical protein